jgi:Flp pilus assembly protein TadG
MIRRRLGDDRGAVAAEFAVVLPAVVLVILFGMGALGAASRHVLLQDAAADAARLAARGEPEHRVRAAVVAAVPTATVRVAHREDLVCVTASAPPGGGPVLLTVSASACALAGGL